MRIPVTLTDLCELAADAPIEAATPLLTCTSEPPARALLLHLQHAIAAGTLVRPAGSSLLLLPRAAVIEADSFAAARAAGYVIDDTALQDMWAQANPATETPA